MQERRDTGLTRDVIIHSKPDQFVINTHALHNAHLIREVLPRDLIMPVLKHSDRAALHRHQAQKLRGNRPQRAPDMAAAQPPPLERPTLEDGSIASGDESTAEISDVPGQHTSQSRRTKRARVE